MGRKMIIGLTGYAQSGKDTLANILVEKYNFKRIAFADPIRDFCYAMNPVVGHVANEETILRQVVDREGWDNAKQYGGVRRMLQNVGIAARETFGENFWVQQAMKKMLDEPELNLKYVITDVRFENEADMIRANGGQIWRVKRPGFGPVNAHISESEMEGYKADQIFYNGGSISDLEVLVTTRMRAYVG